jgi:hypothetical protein
MGKKENQSRLERTLHPILYEVNARVLLQELSATAGKDITLATLPDSILDEWESLGFDAVWLMGVWTTGEMGVQIAREFPSLQEEYRKTLPDFTAEDVIGSPYAVQAYTVSPSIGGEKGMAALRKRLAKRGIGLILDFVCNHTARDHSWVHEHPEYYVAGSAGEEIEKPEYCFKTTTVRGDRVLAFGRDPTYPGWSDTAQLNHRHPGTRKALLETLENIAGLCDGVRCDMAMLVLQSVFERTWGDRAKPVDAEPEREEFWKEVISTVKSQYPNFVFIAEAYWNLEWELQQLGFDYTYDKRLYDRLLREGAWSVFEHLKADLEFQKRSVRFIENHDEARAAKALSSEAWQCAAATVIATVPGMVLLHDGQMEGRKVKLPVQLRRRPEEAVSRHLRSFYEKVLSCVATPVFQKGTWKHLQPKPAWHDNYSWQNFLSFWWEDDLGSARLVVVNYAPQNGQCYIDLSLDKITGSPVEFRDLMGDAVYVRERSGVSSKGIYFDLPGYGIHIFEVNAARKPR